jgi:hypothetical protein
MHDPRIEEYLSSLGQRLKALPKERREDELCEIRQHLEALKTAYIALGQNESEATEAALRQFGQASLIGGALAESAEGKRRFWRAAAIYAASVAVIYLFFTTMNDKPTDFPSTFGSRVIMAFAFPLGVWVTAFARKVRFLQLK